MVDELHHHITITLSFQLSPPSTTTISTTIPPHYYHTFISITTTTPPKMVDELQHLYFDHLNHLHHYTTTTFISIISTTHHNRLHTIEFNLQPSQHHQIGAVPPYYRHTFFHPLASLCGSPLCLPTDFVSCSKSVS